MMTRPAAPTRWLWLAPALAAGTGLALLLLPGEPPASSAANKAVAPADEAKLEALHKKARADGKYEMLLRQIKVPGDAAKYGPFHDFGMRNVREYAGHKDLPAGHWVYAAPYWYVWRDLTAVPKVKRQWGPEQVTGPPDTFPMAGDIVTAWASLTEDGDDEWLLLEYAEPVKPTAVLVYETFNPGAVVRVTAFRLDGEEVEVWKGKDPTPVGKANGVSVIPVRVNFKTARIKIDIDSKNVPGWNEIDAVGLRDGKGKTHWVSAAAASSTYAQNVRIDPRDLRIQQLEAEVRQLKMENRKLQEMLRKKDK